MRFGRAAVSVIGLCASAVAWAGLFGGGPPSRIPVPARDFAATIEDRTGASLRVTRFSWEGEVFVFGDYGAAQVTVPFETVAEVIVTADAGDAEKRDVRVVTREGKALELVADDDLRCWGRTEFGNYRIELGDVRRIAIEPVSAQ